MQFSTNNPEHYGVLGDDSEDIEVVSGAEGSNLTQLIARLPKFGPAYRGFNQGNDTRYHYACVIVSWLRSWYTLFQPKESFDSLMKDLCSHMEFFGVWNPKSGGYVSKIGDEFVKYMNARFPDRKVWMTRIEYGSSVMGGCLKRNIPVVTAYYSSEGYNKLREDNNISEIEAKNASKGSYGHCITFTGIGTLWSYLEAQDNYEGRPNNTYKIFGFKYLRERTWQKNAFFVLLPTDVVPVPPSQRHKYI